MAKVKLLEVCIPEWAICPLINADLSALSDEEEAKLDAWVAFMPAGHLCPPDGEKYFRWRNDIDALGGDVYDCIWMAHK